MDTFQQFNESIKNETNKPNTKQSREGKNTMDTTKAKAGATISKGAIIEALRKHVKQRSGIDWRNYGGNYAAFLAEHKRIAMQRKDALTLVAAVERNDEITAEKLTEAFSAFGGRLSIRETNGAISLDYCTGQYFPVEYRAAACAICAQALWEYFRNQAKEQTMHSENINIREAIHELALNAFGRRVFGRGIAARWFS
jgi:hypothetical protein